MIERRLTHTPKELQDIADRKDLTSSEWKDINILDFIPPKDKSTDVLYIVTGGCGITGSWIIRHLIKRGEKYIRCLDMKPLPHDLESTSIDFCKANLQSSEDLRAALTKPWSDGHIGVDVVFHIAGNIRWWERWQFQKHLTFRVNVEGTANLLRLSEECGVKKFIYLSSGSVVQEATDWWALPGTFNPKRFYPNTEPSNKPLCHYAASKAASETRVLGHSGDMKTGIIRPAQAIFGQGGSSGGVTAGLWPDRDFNPTLNSTIVQDLVYNENVSVACLLLEAHLTDAPSGCRFTVSNDEPRRYSYLTDTIQRYSHKNHRFIPVPVAQFLILGYILEYMTYIYWRLTGRNANFGDIAYLQPPSYTIGQTAAIWDCEDAKKILGYRPAYTVAQGARKFIEEWRLADDIERARPVKLKVLTYHDF